MEQIRGLVNKVIPKKTAFRFTHGKEILMDIELVEDVEHSFTSKLSDTEGAFEDNTDNIKNEPAVITMSCRISDNPVSLMSNIQGLSSSVLPSNALLQKFSSQIITKITNRFLQNSNTRKQDFFNVLMDIRKKKIPFSVITGLKSYKNVFFTKLNIKEDKNAVNCLIFTCTLQEMPIKYKKASSKTNTGLKKITEIKPQNNSILYNLKQKFLG